MSIRKSKVQTKNQTKLEKPREKLGKVKLTPPKHKIERQNE